MKAYQINWELLKIKYCTGASPKALAAEFAVPVSAITKRVVRGKWLRLRTENKECVGALVEKALETLQQKSEAVRESLASELIQQTKVLNGVKAKKCMRNLQQRANVASTVASTASKVFAWDEQPEQMLVNVMTMNSDSVTIRKAVDPNAPALPPATIEATVESSEVAEDPTASEDIGSEPPSNGTAGG